SPHVGVTKIIQCTGEAATALSRLPNDPPPWIAAANNVPPSFPTSGHHKSHSIPLPLRLRLEESDSENSANFFSSPPSPPPRSGSARVPWPESRSGRHGLLLTLVESCYLE
uniref:Uncharacterized protein n=1 Tax=Leersia perrieri TaxID=77586 RepID=A0A0D9XG44_9ORYZ